METLTNTLFLIGFAALITHEMDAIREHEWRFFLPMLDDLTGYRLFTALHIPLFAGLLWGLPDNRLRIGLSIFMIFHAGLHYILRNHPKVEFRNLFSRTVIALAALLGALHLIALAVSTL